MWEGKRVLWGVMVNVPYQFFQAVLTKHHKPGHLKQHTFILQKFWKPAV